MKIAAIHQPNFIPWCGYFSKILQADTFIFLDDAQYTKNSYINRNRIKTQHGDLWLTVPVLTSGKSGQLINEVRIDNRKKWQKKHLGTLSQNYKKAPNYNEVFGIIEKHYNEKHDTLLGLNISLIKNICDYLGIKSQFLKSSDINVQGIASERLKNLCHAVNADMYLHGKGGLNYQDEEAFTEAGIKTRFLNFKAKQYSQLWGDFLENLSILDALFNLGKNSINHLVTDETRNK